MSVAPSTRHSVALPPSRPPLTTQAPSGEKARAMGVSCPSALLPVIDINPNGVPGATMRVGGSGDGTHVAGSIR